MSCELSEEVKTFIKEVRELETKMLDLLANAPAEVDKRWQSVAKTHFQEGRMAAVRSVTEK